MIITIDGPAASGKSTAARELAKVMGIAYLDTGATYRAVTLKALREKVDMRDGSALAAVAKTMDLRLVPRAGALRVELDGEDVSDVIRSPEVSEQSRYVAASPAAREVLVALHRRIGAELGDFVSEGRDQGSVVFPEADVKFYLVADRQTRARRRCLELTARGEPADYQATLLAIDRRDRADRARAVAPLIKPDGAIEIDTTGNTIDQTMALLKRHVDGMR